MLFWVSCMHVFCIFVFALVQRKWACFTWKGATAIQSLSLLLLLLLLLLLPSSLFCLFLIMWTWHRSLKTKPSNSSFAGCLTSKQHTSLSQRHICSDSSTWMLPHWDRSCRSNFLPYPVTVYLHQANQSLALTLQRKHLVVTGVPSFKSLVLLDL